MGDKEAVEALLCGTQAIGAHRHHGLGLVRSVSVVVDAQASHMAWWRPLPAPHAHDPFHGKRLRVAGRASPPYWDRDLTLQAWWPREQPAALLQ
jgi:CRISPR type IV-associated protein Csf3